MIGSWPNHRLRWTAIAGWRTPVINKARQAVKSGRRVTGVIVGIPKGIEWRMQEIGSYLVIDPEICHGQMTFKGTRIPVDTVLSYLAKGYSIEQLVQSWPELTHVALEEAVHLAANSLEARYATGTRANPMPVLAAS